MGSILSSKTESRVSMWGGFFCIVAGVMMHLTTMGMLLKIPDSGVAYFSRWGVWITGNIVVWGAVIGGLGMLISGIRGGRPLSRGTVYNLFSVGAFLLAAGCFILAPESEPTILKSFWFCSLVCAAAVGGAFVHSWGK